MGIFIEVTNANSDSLGTSWAFCVFNTIVDFLKTNFKESSINVVSRELLPNSSILNRLVLLVENTTPELLVVMQQSEGVWIKTIVDHCDAKPTNIYAALDVYTEAEAKSIDGMQLSFGISKENSRICLSVKGCKLSATCTESISSIENYKLAKRLLEAKYGKSKKSAQIIQLYAFLGKIDKHSKLIVCNGEARRVYTNVEYVSNGVLPWYNSCSTD